LSCATTGYRKFFGYLGRLHLFSEERLTMTASHPVTVVVTRVVRPGKEDEFAAWADDVDTAAARFPGHLAAVRLHAGEGLNHLIYQFDSPDHLRAWEESGERRELVRRADRLSDERRTMSGGRHTWFTVPAEAASPRWKTFLITWAAVYPTLLVIATAVKLAVPGLPQPIALAISSGTLTALLTWVILPRVNRQARPWLLRGAQPQPAERPSRESRQP
jgi:uncharacterized protein